MIDYDQEVNKIRIYNQSILDEFQSWLKNTGVTTKTVKNHIDNMSFFAEYLVYYDSLNKLDEADAGDVYDFLADWFPRKAMWACESSTKSYMASFRKFFKFLRESNRVDDDSEIEVRDTLKEYRDEFLDAVALDDDDY
jgi:site-specific recombinase XerD